ncbi:MAG: acyl--CoA ligase [Bacteroidales bacterium]|nr:acyl--CoA ligase [Bacteroidales bacterium]
MTLEGYLRRNAQDFPDKPAVICGGVSESYSSLWARVQAEAAALLSSGVRPGQVVPFRSMQSSDFLVRYFAIHLAGAVALPLEKDIPQEAFDGIGKLYKEFIPPAGTADILYTTGTTGRSKGVMISEDTIIADAENLIGAMGFDGDVTFIVNGPLNHIGSLSKIYPVILNGGTLHILDGMKDLAAFFAAVDSAPGQVATFLVPSAIRMLLGLAKQELAARSGKFAFIETGAAPMAHSDMLLLCSVLPSTRLFNTYASTETGICCTYDYNDGECLAGCLGRPMRNSSVFITPDGKVACKGRTLMTGYAAEPELTASVLRDGTVYTADNAYIDDAGRLHLLGRDDDVINIGGFKVAPSEVEDVALGFPSVKDCICICESGPLGNALALLVVTEDGAPLDKRALALHLSQKLERYKVPLRYKVVDSITRTFNGKLDRKAYR